MNSLYFIGGLIVLIAGAEALVRGASRMAAALGIPPLIVGLTVVAFGTSSPELAVSLKSAFAGQSSIALGNVVGSNIFNVLFILGLSAMITPLVVSREFIRLEIPLMIGISFLVWLFGLNGLISKAEGLIFVGGFVGYTAFLIYKSRQDTTGRESQSTGDIPDKPTGIGPWILNGALVIGGLLLLILGSRWLVDSAVVFAQSLGISELVIGITIIAAGTSLPEVVTSVIASIRGERDIAVGNIIGSNLFNILCVLGFTALLAPDGIAISPPALRFDIPVMIAVAFACLPIFFTDSKITRAEGAFFFAYYIMYTVYLILASTAHRALPFLNNALVYFILPLTLITLIVIIVRVRKNK